MLKLWPLGCKKEFSKNRPGDLLFDPTPPMFKVDQDIINLIILTKFEEDWAEIVASRV